MKSHIEKLIEESTRVLGLESKLKDAALYSLLSGGKRFRPLLTMAIADCVGSASEVELAACATEYFHTASLVVDDLPCMDNELKRRGIETSHIKHCESTALLVSYTLIGGGYSLLAENLGQISSARRAEVSHLVIKAVAKTTGIHGATLGQYYDLNPDNDTADALLETLRLKTASLFEQAFMLGWLFGGGPVSLLQDVSRAAEHFGMAFQIADDIDDLEEDFEKGASANIAVMIGVEKATEMFHVETSAFFTLKESLGLNSPLLDEVTGKLTSSLTYS